MCTWSENKNIMKIYFQSQVDLIIKEKERMLDFLIAENNDLKAKLDRATDILLANSGQGSIIPFKPQVSKAKDPFDLGAMSFLNAIGKDSNDPNDKNNKNAR